MSIERFHDFTAAMLMYKTMKQRSCWCRKKKTPLGFKSFLMYKISFVPRTFTSPLSTSVKTINRVFSHDVTAAILVSQTNPAGVELFSYANAFFCSNTFA